MAIRTSIRAPSNQEPHMLQSKRNNRSRLLATLSVSGWSLLLLIWLTPDGDLQLALKGLGQLLSDWPAHSAHRFVSSE